MNDDSQQPSEQFDYDSHRTSRRFTGPITIFFVAVILVLALFALNRYFRRPVVVFIYPSNSINLTQQGEDASGTFEHVSPNHEIRIAARHENDCFMLPRIVQTNNGKWEYRDMVFPTFGDMTLLAVVMDKNQDIVRNQPSNELDKIDCESIDQFVKGEVDVKVIGVIAGNIDESMPPKATSAPPMATPTKAPSATPMPEETETPVPTTQAVPILEPDYQTEERVGSVIQSASGEDIDNEDAILTCNSPDPTSGSFSEQATIYNNRGVACTEVYKYERAVDSFDEADRLEPNDAIVLSNRAVVHFFLDEYPQALDDFTTAINLSGSSVPLWIGERGLIHLVMGDCQTAFVDLNRAIEGDPLDSWLFIARGLANEICGDVDAAEEDYRQALDNSDNAEERSAVYVVLGQLAFAQEDYDTAVAELNKAIRENPESSDAYTGRGNSYAALGEDELALSDLEKAVVLDPESPFVYEDRGDAYLTLDDYKNARNDFQRSIDLNSTRAKNTLSRLNAKIGQAYQKEGNPNEAYNAYSTALEFYPDPTVYLIRGAMLAQLTDRLSDAVDDLTQALNSTDPSLSDVDKAYGYAERGQIYVDGGQIQKGLDDFEKALALELDDEVEHAETYNRRGLVYSDLNRDENALADFDKAISLAPHEAYYTNRALVHEHLENFANAMDDFEQALDINPEYWPAYRGRGNLSLSSGHCTDSWQDYDYVIQNLSEGEITLDDYFGRAEANVCLDNPTAAVTDYDNALALAEDDGTRAIIYNQMGLAYGELEDYAQAEDAYQQSTNLAPSPINLYNLGTVQFARETYSDAINSFGAAIDLDPELWSAYRDRGVSHLQLGNDDDAINDFVNVLDEFPEDGWLHYYLGIAYQSTNDYAQALTRCQEAKSMAMSSGDLELGNAADNCLDSIP